MRTPPQRYPRQDRSAPRLTPSVYCSLDSRLRNESGTPSPLDDGCLSYSPGSTQVHRHEVLALRFQSLSSVAFEGCLHSVARTRQARLVVPPEPFDAIFCKRVFRVLLQLPTRDQVLTAFVYIQNDRQHRRPSIHFHLLVSSHRSPYFRPSVWGRSGKRQPSLRSVPPQSCSARHAPLVANRLGLTLNVGEEGQVVRSEEHTSELQSRLHLVCRLLLEKKKKTRQQNISENH